MKRISLYLFLLLVLSTLGCAAVQEDLEDILDSDTGGDGTLDEATVTAGIKEALRVGTQNTVLSTSRRNGFLGNQLIRIAIPDQLKSMASTLRRIGLGSQVDELEIGMNRAAERAAAEAKDIFLSAIAGVTVSDAFGILNGHDSAATDYFRNRTYTDLENRFHPTINEKINEIGLSRMYSTIADAYNSLPQAETSPLVDLNEYVTEKALSGLFTVLAREEQKIRQDPLARTTDLLQRVFGG